MIAAQPQPSGLSDWYRGLIRGKTRIGLAWIFAAVLVFTAREYPTWPGMVICFVGATLRFWASGYLKKDSKLSAWGPYRYTRNPLYLGTFLMAIGTAAAIENWWLMGILTVFFASIYHFIILDEEQKLVKIFGEKYELYLQSVWRFMPRPLPIRKSRTAEISAESDIRSFSWSLAVKNKAYEAYASFAGLIGAVYLIAFLWKNYS